MLNNNIKHEQNIQSYSQNKKNNVQRRQSKTCFQQTTKRRRILITLITNIQTGSPRKRHNYWKQIEFYRTSKSKSACWLHDPSNNSSVSTASDVLSAMSVTVSSATAVIDLSGSTSVHAVDLVRLRLVLRLSVLRVFYSNKIIVKTPVKTSRKLNNSTVTV